MNPSDAEEAVPTISPRLCRWFAWYVSGYLRRHFNAVRLLKGALPPEETGAPSVFYLNHPGWWDPLVSLHLARTFFPRQHSFGPMDAGALQKYGILKRLGFFPLERGSPGGARRFLRTAGAILSRQDHALWLTPQGRFTDVRERPVRFEAGLGHLAARLPEVRFIPLALEFVWWQERSPEALVAFGPPVALPAGQPAAVIQLHLENALAACQDQLAAASVLRQPSQFRTLLSGRAGVGGVYDLWRRLCARFRGQKFTAHHSEAPH
jgi:1-acyl-sn-glycerol-3-phosphate acyltransferase